MSPGRVVDPREAPVRGRFVTVDLAARLAAYLYYGGGAATLISVLLPTPPGFNHLGVLLVGLTALATGAVVHALPWEPLGRSTLFWAVLPPAHVLITVHNYTGGADPYRYGLFFVLVYIWVGMTRGPWASVKVAPLTAVAYLLPLTLPWSSWSAVASVVYALPVYVLVGEALAWLTARLEGLTGEAEGRRAELARVAGDLRRANEELTELDQLKNEFVSTASHELRTPLTSVMGTALTLQRSWHRLPDAQRAALLEAMVRQSRHLSRLVDDLLQVSRILEGELQSHPEPVPVHTAVEEALACAGLHGPVTVDCDPGLAVRADPDHLQQILANLLTNAGKYGHPPITVTAGPAGGQVEIQVLDSGPGVAPEFVPNLFDRFTQADRGDRRTSAGLGVGLSIVKALVSANAGSVRYEAGTSGGACFCVRLPAAVDPGGRQPSGAALGSSAHRGQAGGG